MRFTLHRQPHRPVSACTDRPPGGDIDGGIQVCVVAVAAGLAPERLALTIPWCAVPATRTRLTRVSRADLLDPASGFVLEPLDQQTPAACEDAPVQPGLGTSPVRQVATRPDRIRLRFRPPRHLRNPEVFDANHVESPCKICSGLLDPVLAASHTAGVHCRNRGLDALPAVRAALRSSESPLKVHKSPLLGLGQSWAVEQFPGGQRGGHDHATVDADNLTGAGFRDRGWYGSERDMPATHAVTIHPVRPGVWDCAAYPKPHPADLRDQHPRPLTAHLLNTSGLRADDTEPFMLSGFAPSRAAVAAGEVVPACLVEVPQRLLLDSLRPATQPAEHGTCLGQLPGLLNETRCGPFAARPHRPLLDGQIPHEPGMSALRLQCSGLRRRGIQAVAGHAPDPSSHRRQFGDHLEGRESRSLPVLMDGVTPRPI